VLATAYAAHPEQSLPACPTRRRFPRKCGSTDPRPSYARRHHRVPDRPSCPRGPLRV